MSEWLKKATCFVLGHEWEACMIFRSMGGGIPASRCKWCDRKQPLVKGRVVRW